MCVGSLSEDCCQLPREPHNAGDRAPVWGATPMLSPSGQEGDVPDPITYSLRQRAKGSFPTTQLIVNTHLQCMVRDDPEATNLYNIYILFSLMLTFRKHEVHSND